MSRRRILFRKDRAAYTALLVLALALPGSQIFAQGGDFPYSLDNGDWVVGGVGVGLTAIGWYARAVGEEISEAEIRTLDPKNINVFDRSTTRNWSPEWAHRSDQFRGAGFTAAFSFLGVEGIRALLDDRSDDALTLGAMYGEVALLTAGATYLTKVLVGRRRPFLYNQDLSVEERYEIASAGADKPTMSFFSGHASSAFAAAALTSTLFQEMHGSSAWSGVVWGSTLSLAALTAYARVKAGVHFPSDVIVGALVGGSIGYLVPRLHRSDSRDDLDVLTEGIPLGFSIRF